MKRSMKCTKNLQMIVQCSNLVGICVRTLLNNIKVDTSVSVTQRPHLHKLKMTALAAKTFSKFGPEIVIVMYKPFIGYFFMRGEHQFSLF